MHDDQDTVQRVLDIQFDGRVAETGRHLDSVDAVLGNQYPQVTTAVGIDCGESVSGRTAGGHKSRQGGECKQYLFHNQLIINQTRGPKIALPMRTWVDPQSTAMRQSSDMPMESSLKSSCSGNRSRK